MKIVIASDHAGFELKSQLMEYLGMEGHEVEDMGAFEYAKEDDYPDFIMPLAKKVGSTPGLRGIVIGGSGQGEAIAANRIKGVRAALYYGGSTDILTLSREHNDANVLSLGARFVTPKAAKEAVSLWLNTKFSAEEHHARRIGKIDTI